MKALRMLRAAHVWDASGLIDRASEHIYSTLSSSGQITEAARVWTAPVRELPPNQSREERRWTSSSGVVVRNKIEKASFSSGSDPWAPAFEQHIDADDFVFRRWSRRRLQLRSRYVSPSRYLSTRRFRYSDHFVSYPRNVTPRNSCTFRAWSRLLHRLAL